MKRRALVSCALALLLSSSSVSSLAQPAPAPKSSTTAAPAKSAAAKAGPSADALKKARERFNHGVDLAESDWPHAYEAFLEVWKVMPLPQVAHHLGRAELELGKYGDAVEHLQFFVDHAEASDPDLPPSRDWLAQARQKAAKLSITADVAGALVFVDNVQVGTAPLASPVLVNPGTHVVEIRSGEQSARRGVVSEGGASQSVELHLHDEPPPPPPPPPSSSKARTILLASGGVAAVIGLGAGAVLSGLALQQQAVRDRCPSPKLFSQTKSVECWEIQDAELALLSQGAFAGFVVGGLFALGTGAYALFGGKETKPSVKVTPAVSLTGASLSVTASW